LVIYRPQSNYNIARVQPPSLFPGHYKNCFQIGTVKPLPPTVSMNPTRMSANQLNHAVSYFTNVYITEKEKCLRIHPDLTMTSDYLLNFYNRIAFEIGEINKVYYGLKLKLFIQ